MAKCYTIGIDYGTNSVRALVVDCADGREVGTSVFAYPSGDQGVLLDPREPHFARQNPADYIAGLEASVNEALAAAEKQPGFSRAEVIGLGVDTTGSTPGTSTARSRPTGSRMPLRAPARWAGPASTAPCRTRSPSSTPSTHAPPRPR